MSWDNSWNDDLKEVDRLEGERLAANTLLEVCEALGCQATAIEPVERAKLLMGEVKTLRAADSVWKQKYSLLESQIANCHKEMKKLREALLAAPSRS